MSKQACLNEDAKGHKHQISKLRESLHHKVNHALGASKPSKRGNGKESAPHTKDHQEHDPMFPSAAPSGDVTQCTE
jgi:hypothetical protein